MRDLILPPLVRTVADARAFAHAVHQGQRDKVGVPYVVHLTHVHERLVDKLEGLPPSEWGIAAQIAWLHDVIEDTPYTADDLRAEGFSIDVVRGVEDLSRNGPCKRRDWPYLEFIRWIVAHAPLAVLLVKLSDNEDNADPDRLAKLDEATRTRLLAKYEPSMAMLREAARAKGWQG